MSKSTDDRTGSETPPNDDAANAPGPAATGTSQIGFNTLKLRPGMFLQAQPYVPGHPIAEGTPSYDVQFLGIIEGKGVMVVPHGILSLKNGMPTGENFVIRGFTGQHDFHFASQVIRIFDYSFRDPPLAYVLLSYPTTVEARQVRRALRVRASLPAMVSPIGDSRPVAATIMDLSVAGSLVNSAEPLGEVGDALSLMFSIDFEDEKLDLAIPATICRSMRSNSGDGFLTGFLFTDITRQDKLILYYFVSSATD